MTNATTSSDRRHEAADHRGARPPPVAALDDAEVQDGQQGDHERRTDEVGHPAPPRRPALHELAPGEDERGDAEGEVDEEGPAPAAELDEHAADGRTESGRDGRRGTPEADRVRPPVRREGGDDERQRGRHEHRGTERLHDARRDEQLHRGRGTAQDGGDREDRDPGDERAPPPHEVGEPAEDDEEGREHDVVGVEHPRQPADRGVGERLPDGGEGDVDDRGVEEGEEGTEARDEQHAGRSHPRRCDDRHRVLLQGHRIPNLAPRTPRRKRPAGRTSCGVDGG